MREKGFAPILILLIIVIVPIIGGIVYLYFKYETTTTTSQGDSLIITPTVSTLKPTTSGLPILDRNEAPASPALPVPISGDRLKFTDKECNLEIIYPRVTVDGEKKYLWTLDATSKRSAIRYEGRTDADPIHTDHSITVFAQSPGNSIFYSASADLVCTKNVDNLNLETFKEKFLKSFDKEQNASAQAVINIGGIEFFPIFRKPEYRDAKFPDYPIYIGIYNDFLIMVMNSNRGSGKLEEDAKSIINNLKFIDTTLN